MATEVGSAYVSLIPSAKGFGASMQRELSGDIARAGEASGRSYSEKFSKSAGGSIRGKARGIFAGLAKGGVLAAVGAGALIGKTLVESISAASDLGETLAKSQQLFGKEAMPQLEAFANKAATAMGQSKQQALDASATFATFGKSAGLAGDDLVSFSTDFTGLASDLASFNNTTPQEAIDAIGSALRGEAEPMRRYGVLLDDASMRQEALRLGLIKTTKQALTPQQKVLAAQALIYKQTKDAQGDFARTSGGLANQQRILTAQWENAKTSIGKGLLPIVTKLLVWANTMLPKLGKVGKVIQGTLAPAFDFARDAVEKLFGGLSSGDMGSTVDMLRDAFNDIKGIVSTTIKILVTLWDSGFGKRFIAVAGAAFRIVRDVIGGALRAIRGVINVVLAILTGDWARAWTGVKQIISGVWQAVRSIISNGLTIVRNVVMNGISLIIRVIGSLPLAAVRKLGGLGRLLGGLFGRAFDFARGVVRDAVGKIVSVVTGIPGKLRALGGMFASAGRAIIGKFVDGLRGAGSLVSDIAGNVWDAVRGMINSAISAINNALEFTINPPGPGSVTINPPDIPKLAGGGRATAATLALIGEGREAETVLPDSMLRGLLERVATANAGGGNVGLLTITNWRDGTGYFRMLADDSVRDERDFRRGLGAMHA